MELFTDIAGYEGLYQVGDLGNVRSLNYHLTGEQCLLKQDTAKGYKRVTFSKNGQTKRFQVHILVATYFCKGYEDGKEVHHGDFDRANNRATNLSWVTRSQNEKFTYSSGRKRPPEAKYVINLQSGVFYNSITEAAQCHGYKMRTLAAKLTGQNPNNTFLRVA